MRHALGCLLWAAAVAAAMPDATPRKRKYYMQDNLCGRIDIDSVWRDDSLTDILNRAGDPISMDDQMREHERVPATRVVRRTSASIDGSLEASIICSTADRARSRPRAGRSSRSPTSPRSATASRG